MEAMGLKFRVIPSDFDEQLDDTRTPEEVASELGLGKARAIAAQYPEAIVVGSDTIVTVDGVQFGKAADIEDARRMWRIITSAPNKVTTSVAIVCCAIGYENVVAQNAYVHLKPYDQAAVDAYLATGDYADKAGAYSIQNAGALIERIEGDQEIILGLPTSTLRQVLDDFMRNHR